MCTACFFVELLVQDFECLLMQATNIRSSLVRISLILKIARHLWFITIRHLENTVFFKVKLYIILILLNICLQNVGTNSW